MAELNVNGKNVEIKYNNYAFRKMEKTLGVPLPKLGAEIANNEIGINEITVMLWGGLLHKNRDATIDDADEIIDAVGYNKVAEAVNEAMAEYFPKAEGDSPKNA